jgi:hypothetical protein
MIDSVNALFIIFLQLPIVTIEQLVGPLAGG